MDVEMEDAPDLPSSASGSDGTYSPTSTTVIDMGYEDHQPMPRRGSMSHDEERERRASIKAILSDDNITPMEKRRSIQHLMDGRRNSINSSLTGNHSSHSITSSNTPEGTLDQPALDSDQASNEQSRRAEGTRPPCPHYDRKCTMIAPCCGAAFGCRICHDDCPILPPKISVGRRFHRSASLPSSFTFMETSQPEDTHHAIDRFAVQEVICRECFTRQSSRT